MSRLFLIGYRGAGKTAVARLVAEKLSWSWCDADQALQVRFAKTIRQIFADEGEAGFRDKESQLLEELHVLEQHVIATGGGTVLRPENRRRLRSGKVVWLTADVETLYERWQKDGGANPQRPDLAQGGLEEIKEMLELRAPLYEACADLTIDTTQKTPETVADAIVDWFKNQPAP